MHFKHYDSLRLFTQVARHGSFSAAAGSLNQTKGAVSHQIRQLESRLGFELLIEREQITEQLYRLSDVELTNYGYYLVYGKRAFAKPVVEHFTQWVTSSVVVN